MINLKINGKSIQAEKGTTILKAAQDNNIVIPTLCHLENIHEIGSCRICVVEVDGARALQASCITSVSEGMIVHTHSAKVRNRRKVLYELILSDHPKDCLLYPPWPEPHGCKFRWFSHCYAQEHPGWISGLLPPVTGALHNYVSIRERLPSFQSQPQL